MLCEVKGSVALGIAGGETNCTPAACWQTSTAGNGPVYLPGNGQPIVYETGPLGGEPLGVSASWYQTFATTGWHTEASNFLFADGHVKWTKGNLISPGFNNKVTGSDEFANMPLGLNATYVAASTSFSGIKAHRRADRLPAHSASSDRRRSHH